MASSWDERNPDGVAAVALPSVAASYEDVSDAPGDRGTWERAESARPMFQESVHSVSDAAGEWGTWERAGSARPMSQAVRGTSEAAGSQAGDGHRDWTGYGGRWNDWGHSESWNHRDWNSTPWRDNSGKGGKDDEPPDWDGKSEPLLKYLRQIDIWVEGTKMEPERRGVKLLGKLKGDAFDKMELIEPKSLKVFNGVEVFKELIRSKYEPNEHHRVGRIMDKFMYEFCRKTEEEIMDYDTRFDREVALAEKVAGELAPTWKAHLYLKKMRLRDDRESQVRTGALGQYTVEALRKSALSAFPSIGAIRSYHRGDDNGRPSFHSRQKPPRRDRFKNNRGSKIRKPFKAHECHPDDEEDQEEGGTDESDHEGNGSGEDSAVSEESAEPDLPAELVAAQKETETYMTQAKKQRAEVEKARGFFKNPKTSDPKAKEEHMKKDLRLDCRVSSAANWGIGRMTHSAPRTKRRVIRRNGTT